MFVQHDLKQAHIYLKRLFFAAVLALVLMAVLSPIAAFIMLAYVVWMGLAYKISGNILQLNSTEKK